MTTDGGWARACDGDDFVERHHDQPWAVIEVRIVRHGRERRWTCIQMLPQFGFAESKRLWLMGEEAWAAFDL